MNENRIERTINGVLVHVPIELSGLIISKKESSNVDYFGSNSMFEPRNPEHTFWIQFKAGTGSYLFKKVPTTIIREALEADSIGSFFSQKIKGKFESEHVSYRIELAK